MATWIKTNPPNEGEDRDCYLERVVEGTEIRINKAQLAAAAQLAEVTLPDGRVNVTKQRVESKLDFLLGDLKKVREELNEALERIKTLEALLK